MVRERVKFWGVFNRLFRLISLLLEAFFYETIIQLAFVRWDDYGQLGATRLVGYLPSHFHRRACRITAKFRVAKSFSFQVE